MGLAVPFMAADIIPRASLVRNHPHSNSPSRPYLSHCTTLINASEPFTLFALFSLAELRSRSCVHMS